MDIRKPSNFVAPSAVSLINFANHFEIHYFIDYTVAQNICSIHILPNSRHKSDIYCIV